MATVTGLTAERMLEIEAASVVDGEIVGSNLILTKHDGTPIDAGSVLGPQGPAGPAGPAGGLIPGEMRVWPSSVLPLLANYGLWTWANGGVFAIADYPIAAEHIDDEWRTFGGASDPGVLNFRVPDFRGLIPAGLDAMPIGAARANRMTRAVAIILAGKTGKETHVITIPEMANHNHGGGSHGHGVTDPGHNHGLLKGEEWVNDQGGVAQGLPTYGGAGAQSAVTGISINASGAIINAEGGNTAHENVQPTVFVPWIVKLDD